MITLDDYLGPYRHNADVTPARIDAALALLDKVNEAILLAENDGIVFPVNSATRNLVGGSGNGGFRPQDCAIGAPGSTHKQGHAVDIFDPARKLAAWTCLNKDRLIGVGILAVENPMWTRSWAHWSDVPVKSGNFLFVPNSDPPTCAALPEQLGVV